MIDEQELRHSLETLAAEVSAPRFTTEHLIMRIRRRRAKIVGILSLSLIAVAATAVAASVGVAGGGRHPAAPVDISIRPSFTVTVNGRSHLFAGHGAPPSYNVHPGEHLSVTVALRVPKHLVVDALWLGISAGSWGNGPSGPTGIKPILASIHRPLWAGMHTFMVNWSIPRHQSEGSLYLVTAWSLHERSATVAQAIAVFAVN